MKRFFRWLKALFNRGMDRLEDPEVMLDQARRDMNETLVQNRERAVQAIQQRNRLQGMYDEHVKRAGQLEVQATTALQQGNRDLARQFIREKASNEGTAAQLKTALDQAIGSVEAVKVAIKRQEEEIRRKTGEALAMKAQWKQAQIQNSISKALEGLTFENQLESFGAASERIKDMQAEASARQEMHAGSIQGKMMAMEDQAIDYQAEADLQKLEEKLGMRQPTVAATEATQTVTVGTSDTPEIVAPEIPQSTVDAELDALEKRVQGS